MLSIKSEDLHSDSENSRVPFPVLNGGRLPSGRLADELPARRRAVERLAQAYNNGGRGAGPPVRHLDNRMFRWPRHNPWSRYVCGLWTGIWLGNSIRNKNAPRRIFNIRVTKQQKAAVKQRVADAHPGERPPHSTNDALVELFAPDKVKVFSLVMSQRGRHPGVPLGTKLVFGSRT